jgi:hypothetical protein
MWSHRLADLVVVIHFAFVLFVVLGAHLVLRWPRLAWLHVPSAIWGVLIEYAGWICPLTPLEHWLRRAGGESSYQGGFVDHYIIPLLYPLGLTRPTQWVLGTVVLLLNVGVYIVVLAKRRSARKRSPPLVTPR